MRHIKEVQEPQDRTPFNRGCLLSMYTTVLWCDDTYGGAAQAEKAEESGQARLFVLVLRQEDFQAQVQHPLHLGLQHTGGSVSVLILLTLAT